MPLILVIHFTVPVLSQNALYPEQLIITDHIQVIEDEESPRYMHPLMWKNLENINLSEDIDLMALIWESLADDKVEYYDGNVIFEQDFPVNISRTKEVNNSLYNIYDVPDSFELIYIPHELYSIIFIEKWNLDEEKFSLNKEVTGILPVRQWTRLDPEGNPIEGARMMMPVAFIPYPESLSWFKTRKINKRLVPVKKIGYEFLFSELYFLNWYDSDLSMSLDQIPLLKYFNPSWTNYQVNQLRRIIQEKVFNEKIPVFDPETNEPLDEKDLAAFFGYQKGDNGTYTNPDMTYDWTTDMPAAYAFDEIPEITMLAENIYSLYFTEEWHVDPETLFMKKKVLSITPVFWEQEWSETGETSWNKKMLFRIELN